MPQIVGRAAAERLARDHAAGRLTALDALRMLNADEGDQHRCEQLERRAAGISRQIVEASQAISPPQARRSAVPLEDATRRANATFREVTRQRMAEAQQSRQAPPPFAARASAGAAGTEHTGPDCAICAQARKREAAWMTAAAAADERPRETLRAVPDPGPVYRQTHCRGCGALESFCWCDQRVSR
jgi:hypothetical protein